MPAKSYREICDEAVLTLEVVAGMTDGKCGNFISGRAEGMRRAMSQAMVAGEETDQALGEALDRISELEMELERTNGILVAREDEVGHLRQAIEILKCQVPGREIAMDSAVLFAPLPEIAVANIRDEKTSDVAGDLPADKEPEGPAEAQIPSKSGKAGQSVKSTEPRLFRLYEVEDGEDTGYTDTGTAAALANRNQIGPSTIYKLASTGKVGTRYRVEEVV